MDMDWFKAISIIALGALVGYITNWVAIKMLFRPRRAWRIWGRRVPLTPGLFPQRRQALAVSLAKAARRHLLTDRAFMERLASIEIRMSVHQTVEKYLQAGLNRDWPSIDALVPASFSEEWKNLLSLVEVTIQARLRELVSRAEFASFVTEQIGGHLDEWLVRPIESWAPVECFERIPEQVSIYLVQLSQEDSFRSHLTHLLDEYLESLLNPNLTLNDLLPVEVKAALYSKLEEDLPRWIDQFAAILDDDQIQKRIRIQVYEIVDGMLADAFQEDSLWDKIKLGFLEGFLMSTEELKERIDRGLNETAPRLRQLVQHAGIRQAIHNVLRENLESLLARRLSEFQLPAETWSSIRDKVVAGLLLGMRQPPFQSQLQSWLGQRLQGAREKSVQELFPGMIASRDVSRWMARQIMNILQQEKTVKALAQFLEQELIKLVQRPIGTLRRFVSPTLCQKLCDAATDRLLSWLALELPHILQTIDLEKLLSHEVDKLSVEEVEELVLKVTGNQLSAITWFGAVLGGLIGLAQVLVFGSK
jgi:uncharacterized membrane protein YheB (UPF0754 family)